MLTYTFSTGFIFRRANVEAESLMTAPLSLDTVVLCFERSVP